MKRLGFIDGFDTVFKNIKEMPNTQVAILTNIPVDWGNYLREKYGIDKYFEEIFFSGDFKTMKPDPILYQKIMSRFPKIKISNIYFLDNELSELKSIRTLLCNSIWLKREKQKVNYIPDFVINNLTEIIDILDES